MGKLTVCACAVVLAATLLSPRSALAGTTACRLTYEVKGWSFIYKTYRGTGTVRCENGQSAAVTIRTHGGGLTIITIDRSSHRAVARRTGLGSLHP